MTVDPIRQARSDALGIAIELCDEKTKEFRALNPRKLYAASITEDLSARLHRLRLQILNGEA